MREIGNGGGFTTAGGRVSAYWARWGIPAGCGACCLADADCPWASADCNADGAVNFDDIEPFVARIGAQCPEGTGDGNADRGHAACGPGAGR